VIMQTGATLIAFNRRLERRGERWERHLPHPVLLWVHASLSRNGCRNEWETDGRCTCS
jgi:hypothetical protein